MPPKPARVAISIVLSGETEDTNTSHAIFEALDQHGLTPQFVKNMADPIAVSNANEFASHWVVTGDTRDLNGVPMHLKFGADWTRRNAPQGWASMSHRSIDIKNRIKLGRISMDHAYSPRIDWKAAFVALCRVTDPLVATLNVYRRDTRSTLGFVDAFPLSAVPKRERITKPILVDETPWGTFRGVPWGLWMGPLWQPSIKAALAQKLIVDGNLLCLSETVPADPDALKVQQARLRNALPDVFVANPKFVGLP